MVKIILILIVFFSSKGFAQQNESKPEEKASKPIELPAIVIDGIEQLNVRSGIKQFPRKPSQLNNAELDSLNSLDKLQPFLLQAESLPEKNIITSYCKGYLKAGFDSYVTPNLEAGYNFNMSSYKLFSKVKFESSQGHESNAGYLKLSAHLSSDYIAPDSFWIFAGSQTKFNFDFHDKLFNLYARNDAPERAIWGLNCSIKSEGDYEGFRFFTGAELQSLQISNPKNNESDFGLNGNLKFYNKFSIYEYGAKGFANFGSIGKNGVHFLEASLFGTITLDKFFIKLQGGLQTAGNNRAVERAGLGLAAGIDYLLNRELTLKANVSSGLNRNSRSALLAENPYLIDSVIVDYSYEIINFDVYCLYHPLENFSLRTGARFVNAERLAYFEKKDTGYFDVKYKNGSVGEIFGDFLYYFSNSENITFNALFRFSSLNNGFNIPYYAPLKLDADYENRWFENFGTLIGFSYTGQRFTDDNNNGKLSGYFNMNLKATYYYSKQLTINANIWNLLNSEVIYWDGYKERGIYFGISANWLF